MGKLRIGVYNIQYGSGMKGFSDYFKLHRFFSQDKKVISQIGEMLNQQNLDIVGLVEADNGSWRTNGQSQIQMIAERLSMPFIFNSCKYSEFVQKFPILGKQHNAILSRYPVSSTIHRFKTGFKKGVLISKIGSSGKAAVTILLTHLSLSRHTRFQQIGELVSLLKKIKTPVILMGDFNALPDSSEITELMAETGLAIVAHGDTFPSWAPNKSYDHIFVSHDIAIRKSSVLPQKLSDHLPLIAELEIPPKLSISEPKQRAKMIEAL